MTEIQYLSAEGCDVPVVRFTKLEETGFVRAVFTTRQGGISEGPYESMNLGLSNGDEKVKVLENYKIITGALGKDISDVVLTHQTHTANIRVVTEADRGKGLCRERDYQNIDGLVTDVPGLVLTTLHADCTPLYFADPVHRAVALAHSGWRGTASRIGAAAVKAMRDNYGTKPEDIVAAIGPTISIGHYEIGPEVAQIFEQEFGKKICEKLGVLRPGKGDRYMLGLEAANMHVLMQAGIPEENITTCGICTYEQSERFFSHRKAAGGKRGNCAAMMYIL